MSDKQSITPKITYESLPEQCGPDEALRKPKFQKLPRGNWNPIRVGDSATASFLRGVLPGEVPVKVDIARKHSVQPQIVPIEVKGSLNPETAEIESKIEEQARRMRETGPNPDQSI